MNKYLPQNENNGWLTPITMVGSIVTLEPVNLKHCADLQEASDDGELWKLWYVRVPAPKDMMEVIIQHIKLNEKGERLTFAVIDNKTQKAIGMTSYFKITPANRRVDVGWTWYRQSAQKTGINTEAKLLLLTHAFEQLQATAVGFGANWFNYKSRQAIERLGAKLDGVLRNHMIMSNGQICDYCFYSIINTEWSAVKVHLQSKLERNY